MLMDQLAWSMQRDKKTDSASNIMERLTHWGYPDLHTDTHARTRERTQTQRYMHPDSQREYIHHTHIYKIQSITSSWVHSTACIERSAAELCKNPTRWQQWQLHSALKPFAVSHCVTEKSSWDSTKWQRQQPRDLTFTQLFLVDTDCGWVSL